MNKIYDLLIRTYTRLFARPLFYRLNNLLITLGLHGIGIDNYQNDQVSGEKYVLKKFIRNLVNPIIIDVGAHIGDSAILAKSINQKSQIYSFEPNPSTYKILLKNSKQFHFKSFQFAIGDKKGELTLYDTATGDSSPFATLYKSVVESVHHTKANEYRVPVITLDQFYDSNLVGKNIDLLKIDVEGYELSVLKGAKRLLKSGKVHLVQFEFNVMNIYSKTFFRDIEELLVDYDLFRMLPNGLLPITRNSILHSEIFLFQNILGVRK